MRLLRERVPAGAVALVGVGLALPSVVAPTWRLTTLDRERGVVLFDERQWSWGRSQVLGAGGTAVQDLPNTVGLGVLVCLLVLTATAACAWMLSAAPWTSVAGPVASAALLGRLATTVSERHGRAVRDDVHGLAATGATTAAGVLESLAAVAVVVAVALMVLSVAGGRMPATWVARVRALAAGAPDDPGEPAPSSGARGGRVTATITSRPDGEHLTAPAVELGDAGGERR